MQPVRPALSPYDTGESNAPWSRVMPMPRGDVWSGGGVGTRSPAFAGAIRQLPNFGIKPTDPTTAPIGTTTMVGTNADLSEYHAAVGLSSLDQWPHNAARRRTLHRNYSIEIRSMSGLSTTCQFMAEECVRSVCCFLVESKGVRDRAEAALAAAGVATRRWYLPTINRHPVFRDLPHLLAPTADSLATRLLRVLFYLGLDAAARREVVAALAQVGSERLRHRGRRAAIGRGKFTNEQEV